MARQKGPWQTRVNFAPEGGFAYRPGEVLVREADAEDAQRIIWEVHKASTLELGPTAREIAEERLRLLRDAVGDEEDLGPFEEFIRILAEPPPGAGRIAYEPVLESFVRFNGVADTLETIARLNQAGIYAQPNHVLFAHSSPGDFQANPFYANPFYANPFYANPFYANPFYANPFYANPFYANPNPAADPSIRETGRRPSSARPAEQREFKTAVAPGKPVIAILDTGYARIAQAGVAENNKIREALAPKNLAFDESTIEIPDADHAGYLDPVAGHGTFIAGIIEQLTPGCKIEVHKVLESYGDGDEVKVGEKLLELAARNGGKDNGNLIVNLSFGGYSSTGMGALAEIIAQLHNTGATIVASAGNDGTSIPMYPAAIPNVVAVGALDHEGAPAPFSNYGPWVRACTLGVEIVSTFFTFNGKHPVQGDVQVDEFEGWAVWSGTSFAAPRVVAKLASMIQAKPGLSGHDAVKELLESSGNDRKTLLGTVVNI